MKKMNIILSLVSLVVTSFLIVLMIFAWYATNKTASVEGAYGFTASEGYTITLERGTYSAGSWTWTDTRSLELTNLQPGDVYYFRFVISYENATTIQTSFGNIASALTEGSLTVYTDDDSNKFVRIAGTNQNWLPIVNNEVLITESNNNTTTTSRLYSVTGNTISLNTTNYNVADTFKFYNYGLGTSSFSQTNNVIEATDTKEDRTGTIGSGIVLTSLPGSPISWNLNTFTPENPSEKVGYGYFALEFNDKLSTKNYLHIDGVYYNDSNVYQCQMLSIGSVAIATLNN